MRHSHISPTYINAFFYWKLIMSTAKVDIYTDNSMDVHLPPCFRELSWNGIFDY